MRATFAWKILLGLTLSSMIGCGTDRTGLGPAGLGVQPARSDGATNPPPVRPDTAPPPGASTPPGATTPPTSTTDAAATDAARPVDAAPVPGPEPTRPADGSAPAPACEDELTLCGRTDGGAPVCVSLPDDRDHCGACGRACLPGQFCTQGRCTLLCDAGLTICGGACVDLQSNARHCGSCNDACKGNRTCVQGKCTDRGGSSGPGNGRDGGGGPGPN